MALTYATFLNSIVNLMPTQSTATEFVIDFPNVIDDSEQRLYRELNLLNAVTRDASAGLTVGLRTFNLPSVNGTGTFLVTEEINVITPAGQINPESAVRNALTPASKEMLDFLFPSSAGAAVPTYFALITQNQIVVGPWPDASYQVEVVGTIRPAPLSSTNVTTLLSVYFPDLLVSAAMVRISGLMKNYGAAVDDPQQGVTWETHLAKLMASAEVEEQRKRFMQGLPPRV
jgi:hypothetical protein